MAKKVQKKVVKVRAHPMRVPISQKNPKGVTIRDEHSRRLEGTYLDPEKIEALYEGHNLKGLPYPAAGKLDYPDSDKYDGEIAFWTDYFNNKSEEIILEYKGQLKSKSKYKNDALLRFKDDYGKLKKR